MTELGLAGGLAVWLKAAAVTARDWTPLFPPRWQPGLQKWGGGEGGWSFSLGLEPKACLDVASAQIYLQYIHLGCPERRGSSPLKPPLGAVPSVRNKTNVLLVLDLSHRPSLLPFSCLPSPHPLHFSVSSQSSWPWPIHSCPGFLLGFDLFPSRL